MTGTQHHTSSAVDDEVSIRLDDLELHGTLAVPEQASGLVVFAHGSGSSRRSPRNRWVADVLHDAGVGTLLVDLLADDEADNRTLVFDVELLADRLTAITRWVRHHPATIGLPIGYFGGSTGAAAALLAAARPYADVTAVVCRGGRVDLARGQLRWVRCPVLLLVGERDTEVLHLNRVAEHELGCEHSLTVVPGATHLFEEPGTLEQVADHAARWFARHFGRSPVAQHSTRSGGQ